MEISLCDELLKGRKKEKNIYILAYVIFFFCEMSFVLKGFSFWELCKVSSPWLLLFYLESWPFHESLIWIQKKKTKKKRSKKSMKS